MSPIDDELRAALHGRAQVLAPSPDPLAGIERRAKQIRRNRVGAAVAASALAVSAIAVAVPALQSATSTGPERRVPFATAAPSEEPTPVTSEYALDPDSPWAYRGTPLAELGTGTVETITREYATKRGVAESALTLTPLWGQIWDPSGQAELVFLATIDGEHRWGVARGDEGGPEFPVDEPLAEPTMALAAALPGDEVGRLYVVAAPGTTLDYGPNDASEFDAMTALADGVAVTALEGDPASDLYRVSADGEEIHRAPAPDAPTQEAPVEEPATGEPAAALDPANPWEVRGDRSLVTDGQLDALAGDWAQRHSEPAERVTLEPLHVQRYEPGGQVEVTYLVRSGDGPWWWGVSALGEGGWWWYADNQLAQGTTALAAALPGDEGTERLLVVAAPSMGGGMYAAGGSDHQPMTDLAPGVFITSIAPGDGDDRFMVLDGNGDMDDPVFEGPAPNFQNAG